MRNITRRMMTLVLAIVTLVGAVVVNPSTTEAASKKWVSSISHTKITHNDNTTVRYIIEVKKDCKITLKGKTDVCADRWNVEREDTTGVALITDSKYNKGTNTKTITFKVKKGYYCISPGWSKSGKDWKNKVDITCSKKNNLRFVKTMSMYWTNDSTSKYGAEGKSLSYYDGDIRMHEHSEKYVSDWY